MCTTYAAIESSSDVDAEHSGKTIWMWRENTSSSLADRASQKKKSTVVSQGVPTIQVQAHLTYKCLVATSGSWPLSL